MRARNLLIVDTDGDQDPFTKVSMVVGDPPQGVVTAGVHRTEVAEDAGRRAVWNEVFDMVVPHGVVTQQPRIVFEVFDQDKRALGLGTVDNPIGNVEVPLAQLLAPQTKSGGTAAGAAGAAGAGHGEEAKGSDAVDSAAAAPAPLQWLALQPHEKAVAIFNKSHVRWSKLAGRCGVCVCVCVCVYVCCGEGKGWRDWSGAAARTDRSTLVRKRKARRWIRG